MITVIYLLNKLTCINMKDYYYYYLSPSFYSETTFPYQYYYSFPSTGGKSEGSKGLSNNLVIAMAVFGVMFFNIES